MNRFYAEALDIINANSAKDDARRARIRRIRDQRKISVTLNKDDARLLCYLLRNAAEEQRKNKNLIRLDETYPDAVTTAYDLTTADDQLERYQDITDIFKAAGIVLRP